MASERGNSTRALAGVLILSLVLVGLGYAGWRFFSRSLNISIPPSEQCMAVVDGAAYSLTLEQVGNAAIITGETLRRGLPARAASVALATAMQGSSLRKLDGGDRDSVGLFQQRPSQGWGTAADLQDPWYATGKFRDALGKVNGWQTGDINDPAQKVQKSGVPDGYRKHEDSAKAWASALTGHSPAALTCVDRGTSLGATAPVTTLVKKVFGTRVTIAASGTTITLGSSDPTRLWAAVHLGIATTGDAGITGATVGDQTWTHDGKKITTWSQTPAPQPTQATITVRG